MESIYSIFFILFGILCGSIDGRTSESLRVKLPNGSKLLGRYLTSLNGLGILGFMGIPYAEKPVGKLRFKPPQPKAPWTNELQVTKNSPMCTQRNPFLRALHVEGQEDCLYLNVYTPAKKTKKQLPVMVWFHGGGFMCGECSRELHGPEYLLNHDIVLVTVNYRLGPLGFLSTGQKDCPGNNGLKDQAESLKWVNKNIIAFNGNPKQVTIFGESAGGASVAYHMMSPLSKGLFSKAIAQSGMTLSPWGQPTHDNIAVERATKLAKKFNCLKANNWPETLDCLRQVSADKITNAFYDFFEWDLNPVIPFPPVVEPNLPGAFITIHPRDLSKPHGLTIPFMTGITKDEGLIKTAPMMNNPELIKDFTVKKDKVLPIMLYYDHHGKDVKENITKELNKFYFQNKPFGPQLYQSLTDMITDGWFGYSMHRYLNFRFSEKNAGPTYVYHFNYKGPYSVTEVIQGGPEKYYGVCHADELLYLFPFLQESFSNAVPTKQDRDMVEYMTTLWVNFATTGNPTPDNKLPKWSPATKHPLDYYRIEQKLSMGKGLSEEAIKLWDKLRAHDAKRETL